MKRFALTFFLLVSASLLFAQANTGDYKVIKVKPGENLNKIAKKYLKTTRYKSDLLRYNKIKASDVKAGKKIKIPYSLSKERAAKVKFLKGKVKRKTRGSWKPIRRPGTILLQHDVIKTGKRAKIEIQFDDGSKLQLTGNSVVSLKQYSYSKKGRTSNVNLKKGAIFANVNKLRKKSYFKVSTVTAVAGVRGTQFYVSISKNKKVKVEVYKGQVNVSAKNRKVMVKKGQETTVGKDGTPDRPVPIKSTRRIKWAR